jgi:hypothetical protein
MVHLLGLLSHKARMCAKQTTDCPKRRVKLIMNGNLVFIIQLRPYRWGMEAIKNDF